MKAVILAHPKAAVVFDPPTPPADPEPLIVDTEEERRNGLFFLTELVDRYSAQPIQQTLALVSHFGAVQVQNWLIKINDVQGGQP